MVEETLDLVAAWERCLAGFGDGVLSPQHKAFFSLTRPLGLVEHTALLAAPNEFTKELLDSRYRGLIAEALSSQLGQEIQVAVTVQPLPEPLDSDATAEPEPKPLADRAQVADASFADPVTPVEERYAEQAPQPTPGTGREAPASGKSVEPARLNPKYTFETFVIGSTNRFAHAAAVAVAEAPAKAYNPLFVYGESGLGKTHLLHAIGHYARSLFPGTKVRYVSSEEFTNDFINAIRDDKTARVPAALPRQRHPARRRHPVPREQGADAGGVLPHVQRPARGQQADRHHLGPAAPSSSPRWRTGCATGSSGA